MLGKPWKSCFVLAICLLPNFLFAYDAAEIANLALFQQDFGLKIIVFNVGRGDAILLLTPNGDATLIDSGRNQSDGKLVTDYLISKNLNGLGDLRKIDFLYTTHYHGDHIGGLPEIAKSIEIRKAFDQGVSLKRKNEEYYMKYVAAIGDPNNNLKQDKGENRYVRQFINYGDIEHMGENGTVEIKCVSVRGDTEGKEFDLDLHPSKSKSNENPGSIALLVRLGNFEFYTAGDQTDNDWIAKELDTEERMLNSGAIPGGNDIDVLKVNHHGSDTSTSKALVKNLNPEVAIISTEFEQLELPKKITLQNLQSNKTYTLITGDGKDIKKQRFSDSATDEDNDFIESKEYIYNHQGNITILVSKSGDSYSVTGKTFNKTFHSIDKPH